MQLTNDINLNNICEPYIEELVTRFRGIDRNDWDEDVYNLLKETIDYLVNDGNDLKLSYLFEVYAESHGVKNLAMLFKDELMQLPLFLMGREWTGLFLEAMELEEQWPYSTGYFRRSVRSKDVSLHSTQIVCYLHDFTVMRAAGYAPAEWLEKETMFRESYLMTDVLFAVLIRRGDEKVIDYFEEVLSAENNFKELTAEHLRAVVKSGNEHLLELEGKLLLSARLQEGLRQAIVETADEGVPESYVHILKVIKTNNLQRYASIKRGLAVTTGIGEREATGMATQKTFDLVYEYLTDLVKRNEDTQSDDTMRVYLALWAIAFYNVDDLGEPLERIINEGKRHQIEAAMILLDNIGNFRFSAPFAAKTLRRHNDDLGIMAGALPLYLGRNISISDDSELNEIFNSSYDKGWKNFYESDKQAYSDFEILEGIYHRLKKKIVFEPYVFPYERKELTKDVVASKICDIAKLVDTPEIIDRALEYIDGIDACGRGDVIKNLLPAVSSRRQIEFLVDNMGNTSVPARVEICKIVERLFEEGRLSDVDFRKMETLLRLKASETRICIIGILGRLPDQTAEETVQRLISDKTEMKRLAGLEILKHWIERKQKTNIVASLIPLIGRIPSPCATEKSLVSEIIRRSHIQDDIAYSYENGFGLYDPADNPVIEPEWPADFNPSKELAFENPENGVRILEKLMALIEKNADLEFKTSWGEIRRIGNSVISEYNNNSYRKMKLGYPEIWMKFYNDEIKTTDNLLRLVMPFYLNSYLDIDKYFKPVIKKFLGKAFNRDAYKKIQGNSYFDSAKAIILNLYECLNDETVWETIVDLYSDIACRILPEETVKEEKYNEDETPHKSAMWLESPFYLLKNVFAESQTFTDTLFKKYFSAMYSLFGKSTLMTDRHLDGIGVMTLYPADFIRAWELGMLTDNQFMYELMGRPYSRYLIEYYTSKLPSASTMRNHGQTDSGKPLSVDAQIILNRVVGRILDIELKRGSTPTDVSALTKSLRCVVGIDNFIGILVALGNEKFCIYSSQNENSKREVLSHLLLTSRPSGNDCTEELRKKALETGISERRLVEAAVYSPRWLEVVEAAIGWKGLTSAAYYFHAHTGGELPEFIKSGIRRYSTIDPDDFSDGAFDSDWFHEIYELLGESRFGIVYEAAKYISAGNRHARSRKLSDAVLGKFTVGQLMQEIEEKRDRDLIVAFGLIPLEENREQDISQRYLFLNKFLKEGKQKSGAQRQASEARAVKLALDNLARNAGYTDATRLTWNMEAKLIERLAEFLSPRKIDGFDIYIHISEGTPEIVVENNGKILHSIPARLKKDGYVAELKEACQSLKEQYSRGRSLLEKSMNESIGFTAHEIKDLRANPIIWNLLKRLVLVDNLNVIGFPNENADGLVTSQGKEVKFVPGATLRIAHPYDLYKSGEWSCYQSMLFDEQKRQPFKQIFRELYVPTTDELDKTCSNRYSGNQIDIRKTVGVLKTRQWVVDYENGLQRTSFKDNLIARIYAMADWFSPADIEAPTLEYVEFINRHTGEPEIISEINSIVFSEIMRDVDLAVSVAHAGGVNPETSHSTMEMRGIIARHSAKLFGLNNVEFKGNFIKVKGQLANYNIHLGSGVVHQEGGAEIAVLPVYSQSRGRIFMPFVDDDPKTAEIITKMLLFADDTGIKDPSILRQINRKA